MKQQQEQQLQGSDQRKQRTTSSSSSSSLSSPPSMPLSPPMKKSTTEDVINNSSSSQAVYLWRLILVLVLTMCMIVTATLTYEYTSRQQQKEFHNSYLNDANKCVEFIQHNLFDTLRSADEMVTDIVSFAASMNQTWPFVTTPDFAKRASKTYSLSSTILLSLYPVVASEQRLLWENYAATHNQWVEESLLFQQSDESYYVPNITNYTTYDLIYSEDDFGNTHCHSGIVSTNDTNKNASLYLPLWQNSPVDPIYRPYNKDLLSSSNTARMIIVNETKQVVITEAFVIPDFNDPVQLQETENIAKCFEPFIKDSDSAMEPMSDIYYPILGDLTAIRAASAATQEAVNIHNTTTRNVRDPIVGIFVMTFYWREMMESVLPTASNALQVVVINPCNPTFTYEIRGPNVVYLGMGDLHHPKYDSIAIPPMILTNTSSDHNEYTGLPVQEDYCIFRLHVYPSIIMEQKYITNNPIYFTISAIVIFAFTSLIFFIYHIFVERRQHHTLLYAIQSSVNASELESLVAERTATLQETNEKLALANHRIQNASLQQLEHFACMSHEIRTPLNGINGLTSVVHDDMRNMLSMLSSKKQESSPVVDLDNMIITITSLIDSINMVTQSGDLLRTIVDDVLDFAKLGSGNVQIEMQYNFSLQKILDTVIRSIESIPLVRTKNLSIETYYHPAVQPFITTDSRRLQQILYNLLGNAIKFSRDYGTVELHVYKEITTSTSSTPTSVSVNKETVNNDADGNLCFGIKDYGKGIAKDKFKDIFEPFIQAEGARTEIKHGGTGLGLAITSRLIEAMGGTVTVDSELHQWTEFCVRFPVSNNMNDVAVNDSSNHVGNDVEMAPQSWKFQALEVRKDPWNEAADDLQNTSIYLVDSNMHRNAIIKQSLLYFNIKLYAYHSMEAFESNMQLQAANVDINNTGGMNIFLVQEDLLSDSLCRRLSTFLGQNNKIIAFGPNVNSTFDERLVQCKLQSLVRLLPSVLIMKMSECLKVVTTESNPSSTINHPIGVDVDSSIKDLRILIAEDNRINQKVLSKILDRLQIRNVTIVENGQLAVEQEVINPFDVVFMDMHMPIMNGVEACKLINARQHTLLTPAQQGIEQPSAPPNHPIPKVVFLTAHVSPAFQTECYQAGAVGYLTKPCNIHSIESFLRNLNANDT